MNHINRYRRGRQRVVIRVNYVTEEVIKFMSYKDFNVSDIYDSVPEVGARFLFKKVTVRYFISAGKRRAGTALLNVHIDSKDFVSGRLSGHLLKRV